MTLRFPLLGTVKSLPKSHPKTLAEPGLKFSLMALGPVLFSLPLSSHRKGLGGNARWEGHVCQSQTEGGSDPGSGLRSPHDLSKFPQPLWVSVSLPENGDGESYLTGRS